ncbi:hypothetical protein [Candidatus Tokpelaia sp.]|nr:hypothetical protein [Candidatus Tokpelaia sp.]
MAFFGGFLIFYAVIDYGNTPLTSGFGASLFYSIIALIGVWLIYYAKEE